MAMLAGTGVLMASSMGTAGVMALAGSSALGYVASRYTRKYEGKITDRMKTAKEGTQIDLATLDENVSKMEQDIEEALKKAETTRFVGKIAEVAAALAVSSASLALISHAKDDAALETDNTDALKRNAELEARHQADIRHEAELKNLHT